MQRDKLYNNHSLVLSRQKISLFLLISEKDRYYKITVTEIELKIEILRHFNTNENKF